jgi:acyl carrier protein phosphodiesterase
MNYLAHLFLSDGSPLSMLGNFLGDFVKGRIEGVFPREIVDGIIRHRRIDQFTDSHAIVRCSRKLVSKARCRFSGVIIDVAYDHFLSRNWDLYSRTGLDEFIEIAYRNLRLHADSIPPAAGLCIEKMMREDWLRSYRSIEGIDRTFKRISQRLRRDTALCSAVEDLEIHYDVLNGHFLQFFPQLMGHLGRESTGPFREVQT